MAPFDPGRRAFLRTGALVAATGLAGCSQGGDKTATRTDGGDEDPSSSPDGDTTSSPASGTGTPAPAYARTTRLEPDESGHYFGTAVAVSADGRTALVGDLDEESDAGTDAGSVSAYRRAGGDWTDRTTVRPDEVNEFDRFGSAIALSADGTRALVGAPGDESPNGDEGGSAFVLERDGATWTRRRRLAPADGGAGDLFGSAVALQGDLALVGATGAANGSGQSAGAAYFFELADGTWQQRATLTADDGDEGDGFGNAVALAESVALVGAVTEEDPNGTNAGAAYVFERDDGSWRQATKLVTENELMRARFGGALALSADGETAAVGAGGYPQAGAVFVYRRGEDWGRVAKLSKGGPGASSPKFGAGVALSDDGDDLLAGASLASHEDGSRAVGFAVRYTRSEDGWTEVGTLQPDSLGELNKFGETAALSADGGAALVGAPGTGDRRGQAHVFEE